MKKDELKIIIASFIAWRVLLFIFLFLAVNYLTLQKNFLGGGLDSYQNNPYLWAWANFDGEHFLSIAYRGYQPLTYFFFPIYPLITNFLASFLNNSFVNLLISGLIVSHVSFFVALVGLWKLVKLDYRQDIAFLTIVLLVSFPASFYFASFYSESLFLALVVWSFYAARRGNFIVAGLLGGLLTATRVVGIALLPALIAEAWILYKKDKKTNMIQPVIGILLVPLGILAYMYFLNLNTGDPLDFFHSVSIFGEQRSSSLILLPQVFYRYFIKILPNLNYNYFPVVFTTFFEIIVAIVFGILGVLGILGGLGRLGEVKFRLSYAIYLALGYMIPTLSGSFSSLPRYALVLFPAFILASVYLAKISINKRVLLTIIMLILLGIATALFSRGYWVA